MGTSTPFQTRQCAAGVVHPHGSVSVPSVKGAVWMLMVMVSTQVVFAQRPFQQQDPLYQNESALRTFFDRYAITTELVYLPSGNSSILEPEAASALAKLQGVGVKVDGTESSDTVGNLISGSSEPFAMSMRLDYRIIPELDASLIFGMQGVSSTFLSLDWISLKYFRHSDDLNYALRVAANPRNEFGGFPQVDLSFLTHNRLSPDITSDFVLGWRRVRYGLATQSTDTVDEGLLLNRAGGQELHLMRKYHYTFDPAGSHLFAGLLAKFGSYGLVEAYRWNDAFTPSLLSESNQYRGGVIWLQTGFQINRPTFQLAPYLNIPVHKFGELHGDLQTGIRFTVR